MSDIERMAAVLKEHPYTPHRRVPAEAVVRCPCGWSMDIPEMLTRADLRNAHVADALTRAGFGDSAQAWDEGYSMGFDDGTAMMPTNSNPYRRQS